MNRVLKEYSRRKNKRLITIVFILVFIILLVVLFTNLKNTNNENVKSPLSELKIVEENNKTTTKTYENNELLLNPGKGLVSRKCSNNTADELTSVLYYRFRWCDIEPEEGKFEWSIIDKKMEDAISRNKKIAFGVANASTSSSTIKYISPEWVFTSGAEYYEYTSTNGNLQIIPDWTDEIYLEKLNNFIKALGERYDGNENIEFIDIRSYGNWGEQHLIPIGGEDISSKELKDLYIKPYMDNFKKTRLVIPWGLEQYNDTYNWGIDNGISIRRDGIMKYSNGQSCFEYAYGKVPTIFEYNNEYTTLKENGLWSEEKLLEYIENWKPSYTEIWPEMYEDNPEFCKYIGNKIGYYFRFKEANFTNTIEVDSNNNISLKFVNEGVAPLYEDCTVYIGLLDENYNLVKKYKTDIDPHTWMPNEEKTENINVIFDDIEPGNYIISFGLFLNEDDDNPTYLLGNEGKTDDKWYVFGKLNITEKQEIYNINLENNQYFINNNDNYVVNVTVNKLNKNHTYTIERYINNTLIENVNITDLENTYNNSFNYDLTEGDNTIKVIIKRNGEEVSKLEKNIYVYSAQEEFKEISNKAVSKYGEFEKEYANEINNIEKMQATMDSLIDYMTSVADKTSETEDAIKQKMADHYNLGNIIISAYENNKINISFEKLNEMLNELNEIGKTYEDLLILSANTETIYSTATEELINNAENRINDNQDLNMVYPITLLENSKDLNSKAKYINNIENEEKVKTGLIVSNSLHAYYLADWANEFAKIYVEKYIEENPVTVSYSNTDEFTNQDVIATLNIGSDSKVTNNNESNTYTFTKNDTFTFEYERRGQAYTLEATVSNIDKDAPKISGVENGKIYINNARPIITDEHLLSVELLFNGIETQYIDGMTLSAEGIYNITATDKAGNSTAIEMYIVEEGPDSYIVQNNYILNVRQKTTAEQFADKFNLSSEYSIIRNDTNLPNDNIIATGDVLELRNGATYTIIVAGDINCDGKVTTYDLSTLRRYILNLRKFNELESLAADINVDGQELGVKDYSRMRIEILGRY